MSSAFGIVEIPFLIYLQTHGELVKMVGHLMVRVEGLIEICLSIPIQIM